MQRCVHYEQAFEHFLRANRMPYLAVDEARKTLLPIGGPGESRHEALALKSFDCVVYAPQENLIIDIKGRRMSLASGRGAMRREHPGGMPNWVVMDDVHAMMRWEELFGGGFSARFVFMLGLSRQPPDALFESAFAFRNRWYALREIPVADYRRVMLPRSSKWRTVYVPAGEFARLSRPFEPPGAGRACGDSACGPAAAALS